MPGTQNKLIKFIKNLKLEEITSDQLQKNKININSKVHRSILEAGLMGYLFESGFNTEGRESVVRTRISKTNSEIGTKSRDTFLSLMKTTRKLKISFWDYLYDRIHHSNKIENLAKIIEKRVWKQPV